MARCAALRSPAPSAWAFGASAAADWFRALCTAPQRVVGVVLGMQGQVRLDVLVYEIDVFLRARRREMRAVAVEEVVAARGIAEPVDDARVGVALRSACEGIVGCLHPRLGAPRVTNTAMRSSPTVAMRLSMASSVTSPLVPRANTAIYPQDFAARSLRTPPHRL